jgi:hypothetical protein
VRAGIETMIAKTANAPNVDRIRLIAGFICLLESFG